MSANVGLGMRVMFWLLLTAWAGTEYETRYITNNILPGAR